MDLLDICPTTTYFQFDDKFYQQKEGMEVGVTYLWNTSEEIALETAHHKPAK
jgi:hypothetical protein